MTSAVRSWWLPSLGLALGVALLSEGLWAAERPKAAQSEGTRVEMFAAIKSGQIKVRLIPQDSTQCRVFIQNQTNQPLSVKLPEAFAGVPVLAQRAANAGGLNTGAGTGGGQGVGGGMSGMGGMGGMGRGGGGFFNIAPEKEGQLRVATVCLEHGKPDPKPQMPYEIRPIEQFTQKPAVQELCRMLGSGSISQRAAQVAAWHLENNMSWEELANKQIRHLNGTREPYFSPQEIQAGMQVAANATQLAAQRPQASPGEKSSSLSQQP